MHQPAKSALHYPPLFEHLEAFDLFGMQDDLDESSALVHHPMHEELACENSIGLDDHQQFPTTSS
ncbi:MAG: hypothetical protein ACFB0E_11165 [Leptolyngbyaceae cyanobacterium]